MPDTDGPKILGKHLHAVHPGLLVSKLGLHAMLTDREKGLNYLSEKKKGDLAELRKSIFQKTAEAFVKGSVAKVFGEYQKYWRSCVESWQKEGTARVLVARLKSPLAVGISQAAMMNAGITLHHTYGVPIIPGSSFKGACREQGRILMSEDPAQDQNTYLSMYGPEPPKRGGPGQDEGEGDLIFFDVLPLELKQLRLDVMTPHHTKYYSGSTEYQGFYQKAPDTEDPTPVLFLTTPEGTQFMFVIMSRTGNGAFLDQAEKHWRMACAEGFGAKTSSGYGWFSKPQSGQAECD